jgi:UDP-N-acetylglucosamine--N-acetylmuramyl-(pentapeptide) pyrophosphoryl-undecaprenol N-acetylglucosamine transferase
MQMISNKHIIVAAGGTGGHVVPAYALAQALTRRGYEISLVTDNRGVSFPGLFEDMPKHVIPAAQLVVKRPLTWWSGYQTLLEGRAAAERLLERYQPAGVIGFGGYPSLPAMWAASRLQLPCAIHEQNSVLGRTNRWLAKRMDAVALSFAVTEKVPDTLKQDPYIIGNPVRNDILALRDQPYPVLEEDGIFRVLVVGGSQGARILSDVVPAAMSLLPAHLKRRLQVTQQCRADDIAMVRAAYAAEGIAADLTTYIEDMASEYRFTHMVIARAGASTLSELTAIGRPAIFVPLPGAKDNHQVLNCREVVNHGGARMIRQAQFTPAELAKQIQKIALTPGALGNAAARARDVGRPNAAEDFANMVERLIGHKVGGFADDVRSAA